MTSMPYRLGVNRLATRLVGLTQRLESSGSGSGDIEPGAELIAPRPAVPRPEPDATADEIDNDDEDAPGLIDLVQDVEPALQEYGETVSRLTPPTELFNELVRASAEEMAAANDRPNAFAAKIVLARKLAADVEAPLSEIEDLSKRYSMGLLRLDPGIQALLQMLDSQGEEERDAFLATLNNFVAMGKQTAASVRTAADSAKANAGLSKDLRPVLRRFETAMRNIADATRIMDSWEQVVAGRV
jgi:hypothetical protein